MVEVREQELGEAHSAVIAQSHGEVETFGGVVAAEEGEGALGCEEEVDVGGFAVGFPAGGGEGEIGGNLRAHGVDVCDE